jgi:predicted nucleotidyltransferase
MSMRISEEIGRDRKAFAEICQGHGVHSLHAFGSAVKGGFNPENSDIDLLVEINLPDPIDRGEKLWSFWNAMETFFKRRVDLLTPSSLSNPYLIKAIEASKILIYDGSRKEILV